jgi:hypothetical protein
LVDKLLRFARNSFVKRQAATYHFSKEFCENPGNVTTNRNEGKNSEEIEHPFTIFKRVLQFQKAFCSKALRIYKFNIIIKGRV